MLEPALKGAAQRDVQADARQPSTRSSNEIHRVLRKHCALRPNQNEGTKRGVVRKKEHKQSSQQGTLMQSRRVKAWACPPERSARHSACKAGT